MPVKKSVNTTGQESIQAFQQWMATMTDEDYKQIIYRGNLNRGEIATQCGIAKSVLIQNAKVKQMLSELEVDLRTRKILPELISEAESTQTQPKQYDKTAAKSVRDAKRVAELEYQVLELKARLNRFEELSEVIAEMGIEI